VRKCLGQRNSGVTKAGYRTKSLDCGSQGGMYKVRVAKELHSCVLCTSLHVYMYIYVQRYSRGLGSRESGLEWACLQRYS
jgi:hypothetical protein